MKLALPLSVTLLAFAGLTSTVFAQPRVFLVNFGSEYIAPGWNNIADAAATEREISNLVDNKGKATPVSICIEGDPHHFSHQNDGVYPPDALAPVVSQLAPGVSLPAATLSTQLVGVGTSPTLTITGLDPGKTYGFEFFAARQSSDDLTTRYTLDNGGLTKDATVTLNAGDNQTETAVVKDFRPSAGGTIILELTAGPDNHGSWGNGTPMTYLGVLVIAESAPNPSAVSSKR